MQSFVSYILFYCFWCLFKLFSQYIRVELNICLNEKSLKHKLTVKDLVLSVYAIVFFLQMIRAFWVL